MSAPTPDSPVLAPGSVFGRYTIGRMIGAGSMGAVYEALHADHNVRVALKVLDPFVAQSAENAERFVREGRAAASVQHPNVVAIYEAGTVGDRFFLSMEYLEGENLKQSLLRTGPMTADQIADVLIPVMAGVMSAHAAGVIHRDLRPENIVLARAADGSLAPKVLDFGIAKVADGSGAQPLTRDAASLGTAEYSSPEQFRSAKSVDARSDVYSLGVIAYECCTGRVPFRGSSAFEVFQAVSKGGATPPRAVQPALPPAFESAVLRAMSAEPANRFPTVADFAAHLMPFASAWTQAAFQPVIGAASTTDRGLEQAIAQGKAGKTVGQLIEAQNAPTSMALEEMIAQGRAAAGAGSGRTVGQLIQAQNAATVGGLEHAIAEGREAKRRAAEIEDAAQPMPPAPTPASGGKSKTAGVIAFVVVLAGLAAIVLAMRLLRH